MLRIEVKSGENIERALKRYKRKFKATKRMEEIRERKEFTKKSVKRRRTIKKAAYREKFLRKLNNESYQ